MNFLATLDTNVILAVVAYTIWIIKWGNKVSADTRMIGQRVTEGFGEMTLMVQKIEAKMEGKGYALCQVHELQLKGTESRIKRLEQIINGHHKGDRHDNQ